MNNKFILVFLLIVILPSTLAISVKYTYTTPSPEINAIVYKILDNSKFGDFSSGISNNFIIINYNIDNPSDIYYTYHYKQTYLPIQKTKNTDMTTTLIKQSSCKSQIASVNLPTSVNKDTDFTITINLNDITSVFPNLVLPDFIPTELVEYYKADTDVKLFIDDDKLIEKKSIKISTTGNNVQFTTSISTEGSHNIRIETEVTDDQCSSYLNPQTSLATITITSTEKPITTTEPTTDLTECSQTTPTCPPNAAEKCQTGHPRCSCSNLGGDLCLENELCISPAIELTHEDAGVCCSQTCIPKKEPCPIENDKDLCPPDENKCTMLRVCKDGFWTICTKLNPGCLGSSSCSDGTLSGYCSSINTGKLCLDGELSQNELCIAKEDCEELWNCISWTIPYDNYKYCNQWVDENNCVTTINKPNNQQLITYQSPYETYILKAPALTTIGQSQPPEDGKETIISSVLEKFGINIPRNFSVKLGLEFPLLLLIVTIVISAFALYALTHKGQSIIEKIKPKKEEKKTKTHPIRINDLMMSVVESLKGDEKRIIDRLVEEEGITVEELRKKLGLTKTKMDIALTKLERRQILKERTDYDGSLYFNDWLK